MIDRELELKIKRLKEFMQLWLKFHDMYKSALNRSSISADEEKLFLETESLIARKFQSLKDLFGSDPSYNERSFDVISQVLSLKGVSAISDLSLRKIDNDWHDSYIQLNKLLGELEDKQESLRRVSRIKLFMISALHNPYTNLALIIIIILAIYFIVIQLKEAVTVDVKEEEKSKIEFQQMEKKE